MVGSANHDGYINRGRAAQVCQPSTPAHKNLGTDGILIA
jgi:hypothetical protein